jgi:uncharacterized Zn finger protein (UPF0148 family)
MFEYTCPECETELEGSFGEDVVCPKCGKTWETDWDYTDASEGCMAAWIASEKKGE